MKKGSQTKIRTMKENGKKAKKLKSSPVKTSAILIYNVNSTLRRNQKASREDYREDAQRRRSEKAPREKASRNRERNDAGRFAKRLHCQDCSFTRTVSGLAFDLLLFRLVLIFRLNLASFHALERLSICKALLADCSVLQQLLVAVWR